MKRRFSILTAALALLTFLAIPMGMWGQTKAEVVAYTLEPTSGSNNSYAGNCDITIDGITWNLTGNSQQIPWRIGGKSISNADRLLYSKTAISDNITKIEVTHGAASSITMNSWTVIVATDASFANVVSTLTPTFAANATTTINRPTGADWSNCYYKFVYNVTVSGSSNKYIEFTRAKFYKEEGGDTPELEDSDLAITGAPVALSFDLYNNSAAQTVNFTTSSTGAVTVSGGEGYVTTSVSGNTITVTPTAVTPSMQTITVSQAADDNYAAGSKTFTVNITDSTPYVQPTTIEANLNDNFFGTNYGGTAAGITDANPVSGTIDNVTITYAGSGNHYINATQIRFYPNNKLKFEAPSGYEITQIVFTSAGTWAATINVDNGTYTSNTKTWTGSSASVIFTGSGSSRCDMSKATITLAAQGSAVATTTTINVPQDFNTDIYQGTTAGTLTATVSAEGTPISGVTVTWSSSNTGVATIDANGEVTLVAVGTTTITSNYAGVEDEYRPSSATYELTVIDSNAPGSQNNPYTVAQAIAATPSSGTSDNVYIHGIVSRFHNTSIVGDGTNYRYYISDDGTTNTELLVYKGKGLNNVAFSNANDLLIGDEVTICGGLTTYNSTKEVAADNYIVSLVRPAQYTLTKAMTNVAECFVFVGDEEIEFNNNNQAQVRAGVTVSVSLTMEDCYALTSLTVNGSTTGVTEIEPGIYYSFVMPEGDATIGVSATQATQYTLTVVGLNNVTYTEMHAGVDSEEVTLTNNQATLCEGINVDIVGLSANAGLSLQSVTLNDGTTTTTLELEYGVYHFTMPSSDATLTITTTTAPVYTLATTIESGKTYIIVNQENSRAMGAQNNNNRAAVEVVMDNNKITVSSDDVYEFVIESAGEGVYSIYDARTGGYLYAASGGNYLRTDAELDAITSALPSELNVISQSPL